MCGSCEDIVQESFLALYRNFDRYADLEEREIRNILCRTVINKCKDYYKSAYVRYMVKDDTILSFQSEVEVEESLFDNERKLYVRKMVNELKEPYKTVMIEKYLNEKSLDEIAQMNNTSKEVIKTQLYRAKKILKERMKGGENFYG